MRKGFGTMMAAAALVVAVACGAVAAPAKPIGLAYAVGDSFKYKFHMAMDLVMASAPSASPGSSASFTVPIKSDIKADMAYKVQSVDSAGVADVQLTMTNMKVTSSGLGSTTTDVASPDQTIDMKITKDGRMQSMTGSMFSGSPMGGTMPSGPMSAVLPDGAVKPGDTWSKTYDQANPFGSGSAHIVAKSKYVKDEILGAVDTAVIATTTTVPLDETIDMSKLPGMPTGSKAMPVSSMSMKGTVTSVTTSWIDFVGKRMVKTTGDTKMDIAMSMKSSGKSPGTPLSGDLTMKGTMKMEILPA